MNKRVAVVGASGFVGATFVERALNCGLDVVPIIHSSGNAWRLIRHGIPLRTTSLLDKQTLTEALSGCTHVVNCSRGGDDVMIKGLANLLDVCGTQRMRGLVHLSSVMVYGDPPAPNSNTENGTTNPQHGSYGWIKLRQDRMVAKAAQQGLPCVILCSPNIGGPYSSYLIAVIEALRSRSLLLMDDGRAPCNLVDVHNLYHAIMRALDHCSSAARRMFITDDEAVTWQQLIDELKPVCGTEITVPTISRAELMDLNSRENKAPKPSLLRSLKHLISSDVRTVLRKDPLLERVDTFLRRTATLLGASVEQHLRLSIVGPLPVAKPAEKVKANVRLSAQQLRGVRHSCELAKREIGYTPLYSYSKSMEAFRKWYRAHVGVNGPDWDLSRYLWLKL